MCSYTAQTIKKALADTKLRTLLSCWQDGDEGRGGGIVYAELQPRPTKPPRSAATVQGDDPMSEYGSIISA